jgi:diguanylate cyclase (GGDEF)-like protein/PAS domain S-box-containing protein
MRKEDYKKLKEKIQELEKSLHKLERKEIQLQQELLKYQGLFNNIKTTVYFCDNNGKLLDINPAGLRLLGFSKTELRHMDLTENYIIPEKRNKFFKQLRANSYISDFEFSLRTKKGKVVDVLETAILLKDKKGNSIGYCGIMQNITGRKLAEEALAESREFYENIVESISEGILIEDPNEIIIFVNPGVEKMLGYSQEELLGMHTSKITAPEYIEKTNEETRKRPHGISSRYEIEVLAKDGKQIPIIVGVTPIIKNGEYKGALSVFLNITEQKMLQKELIQKSQKLTKLTLTDWLTGLYNYRYFQILLEMEIKRSNRTGRPLSLIMVDIDNLKMVNDNYGHHRGDKVIIQIGNIINSGLRATDYIARYGGDEFLCLLPETKQSSAVRIAQRLCKKVDRHFSKTIDFVSISAGVASYPLTSKSEKELLFRADQAMYLAKSSGGSQAQGIDADYTRHQEQWNLRTLEAFISVLSNREFQAGEELAKRLSERLQICFADKSLSTYMLDILNSLGLAIDIKDHYPRGHSLKIRDMAISLAQKLGLSQKEIQKISLAAVLRDIGTVGIPEHILSSKNELDMEEQEIIRKHPVIGAKILSAIKILDEIALLIKHHHENWDGSGYPDGLKGEQIPIGSQIISLVDVYYSLITNRPFRKAYNRKKAIDLLLKEANKKWNGMLIDFFVKNCIEKVGKTYILKNFISG